MWPPALPAGLVNGSLISLLGVVPFIITLGTMTAYLGLGKLLAKETTVRSAPLAACRSGCRHWSRPFRSRPGSGSPCCRILAGGSGSPLAMAALLAGLLHQTVFGRHVFAIGSNEATARLCGIHVTRTKILVYALAGVFVGIAGMYQFARLSVGSPTSGMGTGTEDHRGRRDRRRQPDRRPRLGVGTLTGAAIMLVIAMAAAALGVKNPMQDIIIGAIIVAAVTLDQFRQRRLRAS